MTIEAKKTTAVVERGPERPVRGEIDGRNIIISSGGRVFLDGKEMTGGTEDLVSSLGWTDIGSGDATSEKQWDWTKKLLFSVSSMIIRTDRQTRAGLIRGDIKVEQVVEGNR